MPDCPKEDIEAAMYTNDTNNFLGEPIHSMLLQPAAAAKPATRIPSLDCTPSLWSAKIAISSFASNIPGRSVRKWQLVQVVSSEDPNLPLSGNKNSYK